MIFFLFYFFSFLLLFFSLLDMDVVLSMRKTSLLFRPSILFLRNDFTDISLSLAFHTPANYILQCRYELAIGRLPNYQLQIMTNSWYGSRNLIDKSGRTG